MKAVFPLSTSDLKAKTYDKAKCPASVKYPSKSSEDELLLRIVKAILACQ